MIVLELKNSEIKIEKATTLTSHMLGMTEAKDNQDIPLLEVWPEEEKMVGGGLYVKNISQHVFLLKRCIQPFTSATINIQYGNEVCCRFDLMKGDVNSLVVTVLKNRVEVISYAEEPMIVFFEIQAGDCVKMQLFDVLKIKKRVSEKIFRLSDDEAVKYEILHWNLGLYDD